VSVDLVLSLMPDFLLKWVVAMKQNRTTLTLAALFLALNGLAASAARGVDGAGRDPASYGPASAPGSGNYANYIEDDVVPQRPPAQPAAPGFAGFLEDKPAFQSMTKAPANDFGKSDDTKSHACNGCYGYGCNDCYTRTWVGVDYMTLWTKGRFLPPLVTTGTPGQDGVWGAPSTVTLFGNDEIGEDFRSAGRLSLGLWLDRCERVGIGGRFMISESDESPFSAASNGSPLLARPFFNSDLIVNAQDSLIISSPGIRRGNIAAQAENDLMSLDAYLRVLLYQYEDRRLDLLAGYQFSRIDDSLSISHQMTQIGGAFPVGTQFAFDDLFDVKNTFHGATLGLQGEYCYGALTFSMLSKLGFGNLRREVRIDGRSRVTDATTTANFTGGMLALPTNIGTHQDDVFSFVPEVELKLKYEVSRGFEVAIGYTFLYWTEVALAGDQIDRSVQGMPTVNGSQLLGGTLAPGAPANPAFAGVQDAGFWAQGLTFGVTLKR
jgi:hypothetical protein